MKFQHEAHEAAYEKVRDYLTQLFGESYATHRESPMFQIEHGSTKANILVMPFGDGRAVVDVRAYVVMGAELTQDLLKYLLRENDAFVLGAFGIDDDDDVFFSHSMVADDLDKAELRASVYAVAATADRYDDEIKRRWGGQRVSDR